jgi:hypothetical protein
MARASNVFPAPGLPTRSMLWTNDRTLFGRLFSPKFSFHQILGNKEMLTSSWKPTIRHCVQKAVNFSIEVARLNQTSKG